MINLDLLDEYKLMRKEKDEIRSKIQAYSSFVTSFQDLQKVSINDLQKLNEAYKLTIEPILQDNYKIKVGALGMELSKINLDIISKITEYEECRKEFVNSLYKELHQDFLIQHRSDEFNEFINLEIDNLKLDSIISILQSSRLNRNSILLNISRKICSLSDDYYQALIPFLNPKDSSVKLLDIWNAGLTEFGTRIKQDAINSFCEKNSFTPLPNKLLLEKRFYINSGHKFGAVLNLDQSRVAFVSVACEQAPTAFNFRDKNHIEHFGEIAWMEYFKEGSTFHEEASNLGNTYELVPIYFENNKILFVRVLINMLVTVGRIS